VVVVIAGGVGAARFLRGLVLAVDPTSVTAVVNTGDDTVLHGLVISPDIDTVIYTLSGAIDPARGWGLRDESWVAMGALERFEAIRPDGSAAAPRWFNLGDRDLATHFYRTARRAEGATPSAVTDEIRRAFGVECRVVPMTDDPVATMVTIAECDSPVSGLTVPFQEYFVKHAHSLPVAAIDVVGASGARFVDDRLLADAETVVIAPSNPLVSIGPVRAIPGVDEALARRRDSVVAISPIVAGAALKGPADRMLAEMGLEPSVTGVARLYAPICGTLVIDGADAGRAAEVEREGMRCVVTDTVMTTPEVSRELARRVLAAARDAR